MEQGGLLRARRRRLTVDPAALARRLWPLDPGDGPAPWGMRGDHDLNPAFRHDGELRPAAVLVPLVIHAEGTTILLTLRTAHLQAHAGQISFPGGGREPEDADDVATALREAEEEIGLAPGRVEIIGRLDTYVTRTGFEVVPIVGLLRPPLALDPDPYEVADVFEVPLEVILQPGFPQLHSRELLGATRWFYAFPHEDRFIWGATAGMLLNLREVLGEP
ncbi:MAG: CoA pyrophosphatase [Alphaproteobacteria bacterium]|jgi:8-oxo-dGTP pyrophosphatase MutT (NUDIX family)|nr:CoA pyrophosphatase [Alphaproteobacteria bacterium]